MLETIANRFYRAQPGEWVILAVDLEKVEAEVRWEAADGHLFPHIYGPIEQCAVIRVVPFPRRPATSAGCARPRFCPRPLAN